MLRFIFVNNYERLNTMAPKEQVRLFILLNSTGNNVTVPHSKTDSFTVASGAWFAWPLNIPLLPANQVRTPPSC